MTRRPYRPSNSTEGEIFMERWCAACILDSYGTEEALLSELGIPENGCEILALALGGEQPEEWYYGEDGLPRCSAFKSSPPDPFFGSEFDPNGALGLLL